MKKSRNSMPAVFPTIILGTDEIKVSNPPTFVSKPSINKTPTISQTDLISLGKLQLMIQQLS